MALKKGPKKARKRDQNSICSEHMNELLGLGRITVSIFKKDTEKGPKRGPKNGPRKINAFESGPCAVDQDSLQIRS